MTGTGGSSLDRGARDRLLRIAAASIAGVWRGEPEAAVDPASLPEDLRAIRTAFVTLEREGNLRGCVGSVVSRRPLAEEVACQARLAAFQDVRFPPLEPDEAEGLDLTVSVLSPFEEVPFESEEDLLGRLGAGPAGWSIEQEGRRGLFLPEVWDLLPDPGRFLVHLKGKAGIEGLLDPARATVRRFGTERFGGLAFPDGIPAPHV